MLRTTDSPDPYQRTVSPMLIAVIHGFILAFPLILPLGAQNVFIFNQGVTQPRFARVLPVVITAGLCDTLLITVAVTGVSLLILGSPVLKSLLIGIGGIFLTYMGWATWSSKPSNDAQKASPNLPVKKQVLFTLSVSLLNPHAIMDTIGVIGTSSLKYQGLERISFASAAIAVSWIWFLLLAFAGRLIGTLDTTGKVVTALNKISAIIMWGAAIYLVSSLF